MPPYQWCVTPSGESREDAAHLYAWVLPRGADGEPQDAAPPISQ